jgi:hypothetical protein
MGWSQAGHVAGRPFNKSIGARILAGLLTVALSGLARCTADSAINLAFTAATVTSYVWLSVRG